MKKLFAASLLFFVALTTGCGPNNPLIGTWESEPMMGIVSSVEFKNGSMVSSGSMGGMTNSNEIPVKEYRVENNKVSVVVAQDAVTAIITYNIVDADTIEQDMGLMKIQFHRKM